jgi:YbbR domain-containing protein
MSTRQEDAKKRDWPLKLLALVCAVMLWFYAEAEKNPLMDMQFDIPVQYVNQAEDYVVDSAVQTVRVTVKGKEVELSGLRSDDFTAIVDLSDAETGAKEYKIEVESSAALERFTWQPLKAAVQIDRKASREVPVRVRTTGNAADNMQVASTEVLPNTVVITGLESRLEEITDVETEVIDISNLSTDTVVDAKLYLPEGIAVQGDEQVQVRFVMQTDQRHVSAEIELRNLPSGMQADLSRTSADIVVSGRSELLHDSQELNRLKLYVDASNLTVGAHVLPVQLEYSGSLNVEEFRPQSVTVTVSAGASSAGKPVLDGTEHDNDMMVEQ